MKYLIFVGGLVLLIAVGVFFIIKPDSGDQTPRPVVEEDTQAVDQTQNSIATSDYGYTFSYPSGQNGYVVVSPLEAPEGDLVFVQQVFDYDEYKEFVESEDPREGPQSLTISVYRNPMQLDLRTWIQTHDASNFHLSSTDFYSTQLGDTDFLTYEPDGLYQTTAYAYGSEGYVYIFANSASGVMEEDMEAVLKTLQFETATIPAQVAHGDISVSSPEPNESVSSPLLIQGEARGFWFFEASFPVTLVNWDGLIIAEGIATAEGEWMTEDFVPFTAELEYDAPEDNSRGALILKKSNPSGLPENDDAIEIPITLK